MLRLKDVGVRYGSLAAVIDVDLELGVAEKLAILGPSGSGKSTLLRAICGLEPLASGSVEWNGIDLASTPTHRRGFGLMFQDYALFPHLDVGANVSFGLSVRDGEGSGRATRVADMLELVGLPGYERRPITQLSGGEQQRVALARALAPRPRLLMLDEPLGALDRALRRGLLDELAAIFDELHLPLIYVTHDQEEALAIGDRVAVMNRGRIEAVLPPAELWQKPPNEFVARFLGLTNIAMAHVEDGRAHTPWGDYVLSTDIAPGSYRVLLRPDAFVPNPDGPLRVKVERRTFRGDHTVLHVTPVGAGDPLEIHADWPAPPAVGEEVTLSVDSARLVVLPLELDAHRAGSSGNGSSRVADA